MNKLRLLLNIPRTMIAWSLCKFSKAFPTIKADLNVWKDLRHLHDEYKGNSKDFLYFSHLLILFPEYRNIVYRRMKDSGEVLRGQFFKVLFPLMDTLFINTKNIGKGLFIEHGFATIIAAKSIGEDCWINQQVTIGYEQDRNPIIGNHVRICCGSIIIGDVKIGDNSIIAAGSVVTHDVPPNQIWGVSGKVYQGCQGVFV